MKHSIPVQRVTFHQQLVEVSARSTERYYLNEIQTRQFQPANDSQSHLNSEVMNPILQEQSRSEEDQAFTALLDQLLTNVKAIDQRREQSLLEMQQVAIELAVAAASHLVQTTVEENRFGIEKMIQTVFDRIGNEIALQFTLHPDDLELLNNRLESTTEFQEIRNFQYRQDDQLPRGSCKVHLPDGQTWLTGISQRLSEIRMHWLEELDAAQVERRQIETTHSSLRRFPDRRETA